MTDEKIEKVRPQYHSEKCPVCAGFGTVNYGKKECKSCNGRGYIMVPNFPDVPEYRPADKMADTMLRPSDTIKK